MTRVLDLAGGRPDAASAGIIEGIVDRHQKQGALMDSNRRRALTRVLVVGAFAAALSGNARAAWVASALWPVPPGSEVRAFGVLLSVAWAAILTPLATWPVATAAAALGRRSVLAVVIVAFILSLTPAPLALMIYRWIMTAHGLVEAP